MKPDLTKITGEVHFEDTVSRNVLETNSIHLLRGTNPNVLNRKFFMCDNSVATTVEDFKNGAPAQRLYILGDGNTTIEHGTSIFTNTASDKLLVANKIYKFTFFPTSTSHKWVEDE